MLSYLFHHGIKGQKWGVRRYQNKDGSLTSAGKKRYEIQSGDQYDIIKKEVHFNVLQILENILMTVESM